MAARPSFLVEGSWATGVGLPQCFLHFCPVFPALFLLFGFGEGGGGEGGIRTSFILRPCTKHCNSLRFRLFVQHTAQGCGARRVVASVHAFRDDAQNTAIYRAFCLFVQHTAQGCGTSKAECSDQDLGGCSPLTTSLKALNPSTPIPLNP